MDGLKTNSRILKLMRCLNGSQRGGGFIQKNPFLVEDVIISGTIHWRNNGSELFSI